MEWSHVSGGRAHLCVVGLAAAGFEGPTFCTWADAFDEVIEVGLLPVAVNAWDGQIDAGISLERATAFVSGTSPTGDVGSWEGAVGRDDVATQDHGRTGIARFVVQALIDPEHPPAMRPAGLAGLLSWSCLEPVTT